MFKKVTFKELIQLISEKSVKVWLCPSLHTPKSFDWSYTFNPDDLIPLEINDGSSEFARIVSDFVCYNCNEQNGKEVHFYIMGDDSNMKREVEKQTCEHCLNKFELVYENGELVEAETEFFDTNDGEVCEECYYDYYSECYFCGDFYHYHDSHFMEEVESHVCDECMNLGKAEYCNCCEKVFPSGDMIQSRHGYYYCHTCYGDIYCSCDRCGEEVNRDEIEYDEIRDLWICPDCYEELEEEVILPYDYKQELIFYGKPKQGKPYFGFELEVDNGGRREIIAKNVLEMWNEEKHSHIVVKRDGSVPYGFEIVSQPMTLDYIYSRKETINEMMEYLKTTGYTSEDNSTCGLHVHISRKHLGNSWSEQRITIGKMIYLLEKFRDEVICFSRRNGVSSYAKFQVERERMNLNPSIDDLYHIYDYNTRYSVVNLQNDETVEIRVFKGTLNPEKFFASIQFCQLLVDVAMTLEEKELKQISWKEFLSYGAHYKELMDFVFNRKFRDGYLLESVQLSLAI